METIKCSLIGDERIGKTCMLISYTNNYFQKDYTPTVYDLYTAIVEIEVSQIKLHLVDAAGQEQHDRLRHLSLPHSDVIVICFSVMSPKSFRNVLLKWLPEARRLCPLAKIILVGTKIDMRMDGAAISRLNEKPITHAEGLAMAKNICALKYFECSAFTQDGLKEVFEAAARSVLMPLETDDMNSEVKMASESQLKDADSTPKPTLQKSEDDSSVTPSTDDD